MSTEGILAAIEAATGALDRVGLDPVLIGGAAMPAWGRIRATQDADLLVGLSSSAESGIQAVNSCVAALREAGFASSFCRKANPKRS